MRIAVFGAGSVGGYFGARLADAGHAVTFIARGAHLDAIAREGLRVTSINGDVVCRAPATDDPSTVGVVDLVLVGVKAWQVPEVAPRMRSMVGPDTVVLPLQNGVETAGQLAAALGSGPVLGGLCKIMSAVEAPGHICHTAVDPVVVLGELDRSTTARVDRIRRMFEVATVTTEVPSDINREIWRKFLLIAPWGGLGSLARVPIGRLRGVQETRRLLEQAVDEIARLAAAHGAALGSDVVGRAMAFLDSVPADGVPSMQRDITQGRASELDTQIGAVVRLGKRCRVDTPVHAFVYGCLRPLELAARGER